MNSYQRYLVEEFAEEYQEGRMSRREALRLIASVLGGLALAQTFLAGCTPAATPAATAVSTPLPAPTDTRTADPTATATSTSPPTATTEAATPASASPTTVVSGPVSPDDPAVIAGDLQFPGQGATLAGYLARPSAAGVAPVILVCHENRGLTDHIRDVTRRLAKSGYVALAVDLLSRLGGTAVVGNDNVPGALGNTAAEQFAQDFRSGWLYLGTLDYARAEQVGMVGFCFGGGVTWQMATQMPELRAAVPFYGPHPGVDAVPAIQAAVLAIYAERDQRINQGIPAIEAAMQANGKTFEKVIYPNADHAFHNDTSARYNPDAAQDAWARTLTWFGRYVAA